MLSLVPKALAQGITNPVLPGIGSQPGAESLGKIISAVLGVMLVVGAILAFLHLIFGAITWITSSGDKQKLENAQSRITQAIVGLIIMAALWAVMILVGQFTGIGFPTLNIPTVNDAGTTGSTGGGGGGGGSNPTCTYPATCMTASQCNAAPAGQFAGTCGTGGIMFCCIKPTSTNTSPCYLPATCKTQVDCYAAGGTTLTQGNCDSVGTNLFCCQMP